MKKIGSIAELRAEILLVEVQQNNEKLLLKQEFRNTMERFKPASLIKSTLNELKEEPDLKTELLNTMLGLTTGFLSKKLVVGSSQSLLKKLVGDLVQVGVVNMVIRNADTIRNVSKFIFTNLVAKTS